MIVIEKRVLAVVIVATAISQSMPMATAGDAPSKSSRRSDAIEHTTKETTTVTRDHRGQTQNQIKPLKFSGTRDGHDPGWGNYEPKKGTGDTIVRDHRH